MNYRSVKSQTLPQEVSRSNFASPGFPNEAPRKNEAAKMTEGRWSSDDEKARKSRACVII